PSMAWRLDLGVTDCLPFSSVTTAPMTSPQTLTLLRRQSSWASLSCWTISRRGGHVHHLGQVVADQAARRRDARWPSPRPPSGASALRERAAGGDRWALDRPPRW